VFAFAGLVLLAVALANWPVLEIIGDDMHTRMPVLPRERLMYEYVHSVERTAVYEVFVLDPAGLRVVETGFQSYGAGLPLDSDNFRLENGWFIIDLDRTISRLVFRVASGEQQVLRFRNTSYLMSTFSEVGKAVEVRITPLYEIVLKHQES